MPASKRERDLTIGLLELVNQNSTTVDLIRGAVRFFQEQSGCESVVIRLNDGDESPFHELAASNSREDVPARVRGRCTAEGDRSIALIPLRVGRERLGLLQLKDSRAGVFTEDSVALWERLAGYVAVAIARARSEESLRASEARLVRAQAMAHVGNWELDLATGQVWASAEAFRIYGIERSSPFLPLDVVKAAVGRDDRRRLDEALRALLDDGAPYDVEFRIRRANDGSPATIRSIAHVERDGGGIPTRVIGVLQDVSDHKRTEEALREASSFNRQVIASAHEGIIVYGRDLRYVVWNPFMERLTGHEASEVLGKHPLEVFPFLGEAGVLERVERALLGETLDPIEFSFETRGRAGWASDSSAPLRNEKGDIVGVISTVEDISKRKAAEEQLLQAEKMESIGRLAGGVAHDFNNILTVIHSASELAWEDLKKGKAVTEQDLLDIRNAAARATELTRQLLAFARRQTIAPRSIDLNERIRDAQPVLGRLLGSDIELALALQDGLWRVHLDPSQLDQILVNFVSNARDALPEGGHAWIRTSTVVVGATDPMTHQIPAGEYVRLEFEDDGIGMAKEVAERIFEPFFTTKEVGRGTGMGLATVHGIVKQAGGHIQVRAQLEHGTRFELLFPRCGDDADDGPSEPTAQVDTVGNERILVVEDDRAVRAHTVRALTNAGYQVLVAGSGSEALELARTIRCPDLLVTDIVMPEIDGRRLAQRLQCRWPALRVLYVSGHIRNGIPGGLARDMDYLQKPFSGSTLLKRVRAALDHRAPS